MILAYLFSWVDNSDGNYKRLRDQVMLLAFDNMYIDNFGKNVPKAYYLLSGARRKAGFETLTIRPISKGNILHTYIAFISDDRERISMSTYLGEIAY